MKMVMILWREISARRRDFLDDGDLSPSDDFVFIWHRVFILKDELCMYCRTR